MRSLDSAAVFIVSVRRAGSLEVNYLRTCPITGRVRLGSPCAARSFATKAAAVRYGRGYLLSLSKVPGCTPADLSNLIVNVCEVSHDV